MSLTRLTILLLAFLTAAALAVAGTERNRMHTSTLYPEVAAYLDARAGEFDQISPERREKLEQVSAFVRAELDAGRTPRLTFVCTHNSRRSQMAQLWAAAAGEVYAIKLATYSGGTEDTAFNPRAVAAMARAGVHIDKTTDDVNSVYHARLGDSLTPITCFSKAYHNPPNPKDHFGAVMVCTDADEACPAVPGAAGRFAIPFVDPKISDGTPLEASTYDERCAQIARETLYLMSRVRD